MRAVSHLYIIIFTIYTDRDLFFFFLFFFLGGGLQPLEITGENIITIMLLSRYGVIKAREGR